MDQIQLLKKKNDMQRFISLLDESAFEKLENYLIESDIEVDADVSPVTEELIENVIANEDSSLLTEEVKDKLKVIFQASVNDKVQEKVKAIHETVDTFFTENQESVDKYAEYVKTELVALNEQQQEELETKLDAYLDYVITEWVEENKIALETGVKTQISESVLSGLKKLFESNYIEVPEKPISLIQELESKTKQLYESNVELNTKYNLTNKKLSDLNKKFVVLEATAGMTSEFDKDKLVVLSESIKAKTVDEFKNKVQAIKETIITKPTPERSNVTQTQLDEGKKVEVELEETYVDPKIKQYLSAFSKKVD